MARHQTLSSIMVGAYFTLKTIIDDPQIQAQLAPYGYGPEKMAEGMAVYENANTAVHTQTVAEAEQSRASRVATAAHRELREAYQRIKRIAKAAWGKTDPAKLRTLGLHEPMPTRMNDFIEAARKLFMGLEKPEISAPLAQFGYGAAKIAAERLYYTRFMEAHDHHAQSIIDTSTATTTQQQQVLALQDWMRRLKLISNVALEEGID